MLLVTAERAQQVPPELLLIFLFSVLNVGAGAKATYPST
jgi:hypothetical protein